MSRIASTVLLFIRRKTGNAAVEFAILAPILLLLIAGTIDLGIGFQRKLELQSALNTGLQHVMQTQGDDIATTKAVIQHGLGTLGPATMTAETFCRCDASSASCTTTCTNGLDRFAKASVAVPYSTPIFEMDMTLSAAFEVYVGEAQ